MNKKLLVFISLLAATSTLRPAEKQEKITLTDLPVEMQTHIMDFLGAGDIKNLALVNRQARAVTQDIRSAYREKFAAPLIDLKADWMQSTNFDAAVTEFVQLHQMRDMFGFGNFCTKRYNDLRLFIFKALRNELVKLVRPGWQLTDVDTTKFDFLKKFNINPDLFRNEDTDRSRLCYGDNYSLLFLATHVAHFDIFEKILLAGANPNLEIELNGTALNEAVLRMNSDKRFIEKLLQAGADINAINPYGMTPLHAVIYFNFGSEMTWNEESDRKIKNALEIIKLFLDKNADLSIKDAEGHTPLTLAVNLIRGPFLTDLSPKKKALQIAIDLITDAEKKQQK